MTARVSVAPALLQWACERSGVPVAGFVGTFRALPKWVNGEQKPTLKQLERFAKATRAPLGYFFLPEPPVERLPIPDFRTLKGARLDRPSPDLLDTIQTMQRRQAWLRETLLEDGIEPLSFVGSATSNDSPESVGAEMRRVVGLEDTWASDVSTWQAAVGELRRRIEKLGVMAVINGVVGNDTHRKLDVSEFRGFALSDAHAPLVFVNGADAKSAQMFTLAHELAHVWLGAAGVSGFEGLIPPSKDIEGWCNRAAAEFLVPARTLKLRWPDARRAGSPFDALAREFKVSPVVAARRVLDLRLIGRDEFIAFYDAYTTRERQGARPKSSGNFYNNQNTRVGELLAKRVIRSALEGRIGFKEAYALTGLHGGSFQKYAALMGVNL